LRWVGVTVLLEAAGSNGQQRAMEGQRWISQTCATILTHTFTHLLRAHMHTRTHAHAHAHTHTHIRLPPCPHACGTEWQTLCSLRGSWLRRQQDPPVERRLLEVCCRVSGCVRFLCPSVCPSVCLSASLNSRLPKYVSSVRVAVESSISNTQTLNPKP
jgi:hypothetical protein